MQCELPYVVSQLSTSGEDRIVSFWATPVDKGYRVHVAEPSQGDIVQGSVINPYSEDTLWIWCLPSVDIPANMGPLTAIERGFVQALDLAYTERFLLIVHEKCDSHSWLE